MTTLSFVLSNGRFLAFGFSLALFASFGQTYFIALYSAELREAFGIGHGVFGSIYAAATLTSAVLMLPAGQAIDRVDLRPFSAVLAAGIAAACLFMAAVPVDSIVFLYLAILLLRFFGQGMMSHASATSMARYFDHARGRAISIGSLGHAGGEAVFPILAVLLVGVVGWRESWAVIGGVLALGLIPLLLWLLKGHGGRHAEFLRRMAAPGEDIARGRQWSRREVLRDRFFHLLLPMVMAPSFIVTGIFFNQVPFVETKGWTLSLFAGGFTVYAGATVGAALLAGGLVDRLGATRLSPFILLPLAFGLLLLGIFDDPITVFAFMASAGISTGLFNTVTGALFAEVYGVRHLGAIRAMTTSLMVFSTALSPVAMGWLLEAGVGMEAISLACFLGVLLASALFPLALAGRRDKAFRAPETRGH